MKRRTFLQTIASGISAAISGMAIPRSMPSVKKMHIKPLEYFGRPVKPAVGDIHFNPNDNAFHLYDGITWRKVSG